MVLMYNMMIMFLCIMATMALLSSLCCLFMKFSDRRLKSYILETAKRKGYKVDLDKLNPKPTCPSPLANENCTIMIPEVGIIL